MTRDELLAKLAEYAEIEPEGGHALADQALLDFIDDPLVAAAFDSLTKWYS